MDPFIEPLVVKYLQQTKIVKVMNLRKITAIDKLLRGSNIPLRKWYYFLEVEYLTDMYERRWYSLDKINQLSSFNHIRVKKTQNPNLSRLLYQRVDGLVVECDS